MEQYPQHSLQEIIRMIIGKPWREHARSNDRAEFDWDAMGHGTSTTSNHLGDPLPNGPGEFMSDYQLS